MGNRSKRGRPDPDAPDPVEEWQEEARWSGYTSHIRWWQRSGDRTPSSPGGFRMPGAGEWLGIAILVACVLGAVLLIFWLLSLVFT